MILNLNHLHAKSAAGNAQSVVETMYGLLEEGLIDQSRFARLRIQLDWVQYKQNFREVVSVVECRNQWGEQAIMDIHVDTRQVVPGPGCLRKELLRAISRTTSRADGALEGAGEPDRIFLEDFTTFRKSVAWRFNSLYWRRLNDWERATGKGYEQALPGGQSDGHVPEAITDSVNVFWKLLCDMESKKQLPQDIFMLEIGVGSGARCKLWLDGLQEMDRLHGTAFYPRLRMLLGDYSLATLDMSKPAVKEHADLCSFVVLDALNPLQTLSFLRHKLLHVHSNNMYDNLPDEDVLRRDGRLYLVEARLYLPIQDAMRIATTFDVPMEKLQPTVERLLEGGAEFLGDYDRGMGFWMEVWKAVRMEERLVDVDDLPDSPFPAGLDAAKLEDMLEEAPSDIRFHMSSGAVESFSNTLPLLYPRGYLQVQDIFVTEFDQYRVGFHGPGKLDGSIVNWVNGALLRKVAERAGFDVRFELFQRRKGSKTSILYTTQRE
jgi:hypothetical protein